MQYKLSSESKKIKEKLRQEEINIKKIEEKDLEFYFSSLNMRLGNLAEIFRREKDDFVVPFLDLIGDSLKLLELKHDLSGHDRVNFSLTIDPTESGFPTVKDFYLLKRDKEISKSVLDKLPSHDTIIDDIRGGIMKKKSIIKYQTQLRRYNYYSKLKKIKVLEEYEVSKPKQNSKSNPAHYSIDWFFIERFSNIPIFYRMLLTQDNGVSLKDKLDDGLSVSIYNTRNGHIDVRSFVQNVDRADNHFHPKMVEKYSIGPFYNRLTINDEHIDNLLKDEDDSILKFSKSTILSTEERKTNGGFFNRLLGNVLKREVYGPLDIENKMIVPFKMKQNLGDYDEYGNPCKVYAVTKEGSIVV